MSDEQQTSILQLSDQIGEIVERLAEAETSLEAALGNQVDAIIDPRSATPILLKRAQQTLSRSEARYRRLVGQMSAVIFELEPGGTILFVNEAVETITGYEPEELQGQNWWDVFFPGERQRAVEPLRHILQSGDVTDYEAQLTAKDGSTVILEINSANQYTGGGELERVLGFGIDATERKQAEQRLRASQERVRLALEQTEEERNKLRVLLDSITEEVWFVNADARLSLLNEAAREGLGPRIQDFEGLDDVLAALEVLLPDGTPRPPEEAPLYRALHHGEVVRNHEEWARRLDTGEQRIRLANASPVYNLDGQIIGAVATVRDVTEREAHRQRKQQLEREREARMAAEEANRFKTRLLGMVSHELRTPLTSILGFASTLLADDVEWEESSQQDFIQTILSEAEKLNELVDQLLQASRLEAGRLDVRPEPLDFSAIVGTARVHLEVLTAQHELLIEVPQGLPAVAADLRRVAQVLSNLVKNAVQHAPQGTQIRVSVQQLDSHLQVDVSDEGPGIPPSARQYVFEAFRQVEGSAQGKGAGLGLAIAKGIVEAHGGEIWVQDSPPPDTTVSFTLPLADG